MNRALRLAALYALFAAMATAANLGAQWLSLRLYQGEFSLALAMGWGTGAGLVVKYLLDKKWIFRHRGNDLDLHMRKFSGYALTGLATTLLFWGSELAFNAIPPHGQWRFAGAALGLAVGYAAKYRLDKHFVFHGGDS